MRDHEPIEIAVPAIRRVIAAALLLVSGAILVGFIPFTAQVVGLALLVAALGLLV